MLRSRSHTARWLAFAIGVGLAMALDGCASAPPDRTAPSPAPRPDSVRRDTGKISAIPGRAVDMADVRGRSSQKVEELLVGRFPGVRVLRTPGGGLEVRVRGASTIMGSEAPLYVVNGTPIEPGPEGLSFLDPYDIARIEVLKDVASTSIYGVRGANGVIVITTKK